MVYLKDLIVKEKWQSVISSQRSVVGDQKKDLLFRWMCSTIHPILILYRKAVFISPHGKSSKSF